MEKFNEFEKEYFMQTRREIDTEKRERDQLLHFAVVVLGALGFAFVQSDTAREFLKKPHSLMFETSILVILTSLFWVRRKKLQQIADRWYTLYKMASRLLGKENTTVMMEEVVIRGFKKARYLRKDIVLNFALSLPVYTLLFVSASGLTSHLSINIVVPVLVVAVHMLLSVVLLATKMQDPFSVSPSCLEKNEGNGTILKDGKESCGSLDCAQG